MDWQFFNDNSALMQVFITFIQAVITFILAVITGIYVYITHKILKEQEKARKISFIERRLEKLYYPLKNFIEDLADFPIKDSYGNYHKDFKLDKFDKIVQFEYLILSNDSKDKIKEFLNKIIKAKQDENVKFHRDSIYENMRAEKVQVIKEIIDQDIQTLQDELDELVYPDNIFSTIVNSISSFFD